MLKQRRSRTLELFMSNKKVVTYNGFFFRWQEKKDQRRVEVIGGLMFPT